MSKKKDELEQVELFFHLTNLGRKKNLFASPIMKHETQLPKQLEEVMLDPNKFQTIVSGITDQKERQKKMASFFKEQTHEVEEKEEDFWSFIKSSRVEKEEKVDFRTILQNSRIDRKAPVHIIETDEYKDKRIEKTKKFSSFRDIPMVEEVITEVKVDFAYVLNNKELSKAYEQFLLKEHNQNQFTFLRKLDDLVPVDSSTTAKSMASLVNELYNSYIKEGSKMELNIGAEARKEIEEKLKEQIGIKDYWKLSESPSTVFNVVKGVLLLEMKYDTFMRFQKTDKFKEILKNIQKKNRSSTRSSMMAKSTGKLNL